MRNANGTGSVYKLSGRRRKPWIAIITTGWEIKDNKDVQVRKVLGYFSTKVEAQRKLFEFNDNNFNIDALNYTFEDVYKKMIDNKRKDLSISSIKAYQMAFNILSPLHSRKFAEIKLKDYQKVFNDSGKEYHTLRKTRTLVSQIFDFCIKNDFYNGNNLSEHINIGKNVTEERVIFSNKEIETLWNNKDNDIIKIILILIYSGLRIGELLDLKKENVHINERYFKIVDSKTTAGIRKVPLNQKILDLIEYFYNKNDEFFITNKKGTQFKYSNFKTDYFDKIIRTYEFNDKISIHSTRHTCVSLLVNANANQTHIKKIIGHAAQEELFEKVYTHSTIQELIQTIDMI